MNVYAFWRRLDTPGHDAANVTRTANGWRLEGTAVFGHDLGPARHDYWVDCATDWRTCRGGVSGWVGSQRCDVSVTRSAPGLWSVGDETLVGFEHCLDLDFGFTPATNFLQLHRCNLRIGETAAFQTAVSA